MQRLRASFVMYMLLGLLTALFIIPSNLHSQVKSGALTSGPIANGLSIHGTVKIILPNKNGMVALSDSKLSANGKALGHDQKLFQVDDHTVLMIAGWYSGAGGTVAGTFQPNYTAIPQIIDLYIQAAGSRLAQDSLEEKANDLSAIFAFTLQVLADMDAEDGIGFNPSKSELTLAGYDSGVLKILQVDLVPHDEPRAMIMRKGLSPTLTSGIRYGEENRCTTSVREILQFKVRGIQEPSRAFLEDPTAHPTTEPSLVRFSQSMSRDRGKTLSLEEMKQVALSLKARTEAKYPNQVGGPPQIAILSEGLVRSVSQPYAHGPLKDTRTTAIGEILNGGLANHDHLNASPVEVLYPASLFVSDFKMKTSGPIGQQARAKSLRMRSFKGWTESSSFVLSFATWRSFIMALQPQCSIGPTRFRRTPSST